MQINNHNVENIEVNRTLSIIKIEEGAKFIYPDNTGMVHIELEIIEIAEIDGEPIVLFETGPYLGMRRTLHDLPVDVLAGRLVNANASQISKARRTNDYHNPPKDDRRSRRCDR